MQTLLRQDLRLSYFLVFPFTTHILLPKTALRSTKITSIHYAKHIYISFQFQQMLCRHNLDCIGSSLLFITWKWALHSKPALDCKREMSARIFHFDLTFKINKIVVCLQQMNVDKPVLPPKISDSYKSLINFKHTRATFHQPKGWRGKLIVRQHFISFVSVSYPTVWSDCPHISQMMKPKQNLDANSYFQNLLLIF